MPISEQEARALLHRTYNFKSNKFRRGTIKHRISWHWMHEGIVMVPDVVAWRVYPGFANSFDSDRLANDLGLHGDDMEKARDGVYSKACLQLVFLVYQVSRFLRIVDAWDRQRLIEYSPIIADAIRNRPLEVKCCELLLRHRGKIDDIRRHDDMHALGEALVHLITPIRCWEGPPLA